MKQYIITILTISIIGGIISCIVGESNDNLKKHINFVVGLICAIVLLSPIVSFVNNASELNSGIHNMADKISGTDKITSEHIINTSIENIEGGIKNEIVNHFKFSSSDVEVIVNTKEKGGTSLIISDVTVILSNKASWYDDGIIKEYITNLIGCNVTIQKR